MWCSVAEYETVQNTKPLLSSLCVCQKHLEVLCFINPPLALWPDFWYHWLDLPVHRLSAKKKKKINTENERKMPAAKPPIGMSFYGDAGNRSVVGRRKEKKSDITE